MLHSCEMHLRKWLICSPDPKPNENTFRLQTQQIPINQNRQCHCRTSGHTEFSMKTPGLYETMANRLHNIRRRFAAKLMDHILRSRISWSLSTFFRDSLEYVDE